MKRRVQLLTAAAALAIAVPAGAQVKRRDHRREKPPEPTLRVTQWSPQNGPVGTTVVIDGEGFSRRTELWFGGSALKPRRLSARQITFIVPKDYGDGKIVLRDPDAYSGDYVVGSYAVIMPPEIRRMEPGSGVYGSKVEIHGEYFQNGDRVLINGKPIKILSLAADRIVCEIPDWATTDFIIVSRDGGYEARTRGKFRVIDPAPTITRIAPDYGPGGTTVRLDGTHFTDGDRVFYGRRPVPIAQRGNGWIEVVVPDRARESQYFTLRGPGGEARSPQMFNLDIPPRIARFAPAWGGPGSQIEVYGENFRDGDRLQIGGTWVRVVQTRPGQITIEVPPGARSGPLVLWRGKDQWSAPNPFDVAYPPEIREWGPHSGDYGTRVSLRGTHFDESCEVFYGGQKLGIARRDGDHTLEVVVPRGVRDDHFVVRSRYGEVKTGKPFQIYLPPVIRGFGPRSGRPGSQLAIRGVNFTDRTRILIGQWPAKIIALKNERAILVEVPGEATAGEWDVWVQDGDYKEKAGKQFLVEGYATLDGVDPWRATYGETIVLSGNGLASGVKVYFGNTELAVKRWDRRGKQAWIVIPDGLSGSDWLYIDDSGKRVRSSQKFEIYAPAPDGPKVRDHRRRKDY
jgi:hypothetical protein